MGATLPTVAAPSFPISPMSILLRGHRVTGVAHTMSSIEPAERIAELRALLDEALGAADALELEIVAVHLAMARDALGTDKAAE